MAHENDEAELARFTKWLRRRPNSLEYWELVLTDDRLVWCFVGESYRSLLLRADMGERDRAIVADSATDELADLDERNFSVPIEALEEIRLVVGTRLRRPRLDVGWRATSDEAESERDGSNAERERRTLYGARGAASHRELVTALRSDPRLDHVDVSVAEPRLSFL